MKKETFNKTTLVMVEGQEIKIPEGDYELIDTDIVDIKEGKAVGKKVGKKVFKYAKKGVKKTLKVIVKKQNRFVAFFAVLYNFFFSTLVKTIVTSVAVVAAGFSIAAPLALAKPRAKPVTPTQEQNNEPNQQQPGPVNQVDVTGVTLSNRELSINIDDTDTLVATVSPDNATNKGVIWTVDNSDILSIDQNGTYKGLSVGNAKVTCTTIDGNKIAECNFTVSYVDPLRYCMKATNESEDTVGLYYQCNADQTPIYYSRDGETWEILGDNGISFGTGNYAYFKSSMEDNWADFGSLLFCKENASTAPLDNKGIALTGTVMSLLYGSSPTETQLTTIPEEINFCSLFYCSDAITYVDEDFLPATNLPDATGEHLGVYSYLFAGCTNLQKGPKLPAAELPTYAYSYMFAMSGLTECPELPATTCAEYAYSDMFIYCEGIEDMPKINAKNIGSNAFSVMFANCTNLKNLQSKLCESTSMPEEACEGMFEESGIETIPEDFLPYVTLGAECYKEMFAGCEGLVNVSLKLPATKLEECCYEGMFKGCKNMVSAPYLPATTLVDGCYMSMFKDCESLYVQGFVESNGNIIFKCPSYSENEVILPVDDMFAGTKNWRGGNPEQGLYYTYSISVSK